MNNNELKPTVTLATRTNKTDNQEVKLRFRVRCGRSYQYYYKSGIVCSVGNLKRFNPDCSVKGRTIVPPAQLQNDISEVVAKLKRAAFAAVERGITSSDEFTALMKDKAVTGEKSTLLQDFADYIHERSTNDDEMQRITDATVTCYKSTFKQLQAFLVGRGLDNVSIQDFTPQMLIDFLKFLGSNVSQNSRSEYSTKLRKFFGDMEDRDLIAFSPFNRRKKEIQTLTARKRAHEPFALTLDEVKLIASTDVPQHLQRTKEIFMMQTYLGCRVRDLGNITMSDVKEHPDGFKYIRYIPQKTAKSDFKVETPLVPSAVAMLDGGVSLPMRLPATKVINDQIKALLHHCGINRTVEVRDKAAQRLTDSPLWYVVTSKICRRTAESLLTAYQVNMFTSGLHAVGSDAIKSYVDMSLTQRYRLMCLAYGETPTYNETDKDNNV